MHPLSARGLLRPAIVATLATALAAVGTPMIGSAAATPAAATAPTVETGLVSSAGRVVPSATAAPRPRSKGVRILPRTLAGRAALARAAGQGPSTPSSKEDGGSGGLINNFNGVSSLDSAVTNFGLQFEPPDQGLCEGNGFVLEPVNSAYTIYRPDGRVVAGPFNVNVLFQRGLLQFTSDPRCIYDQTTNTWFAEILFLADDGLSSSIDIAVNPSGDPTTAWTVYHVDTTDPHGQACPCFGDQPRIGIDAYNIYFSTDEFPIDPNATNYNGPQLYALAKSDLVRLRQTVHMVHFGNLTMQGTNQFVAIEPAITTGPSDAEYFLNALDLKGAGDTNIGVWAMTNRQAVARGRAPRLSSMIIPSEAYAIPPQALQKGSTGLLDSGDDRMQQTQFINGTIWGALGTVVTPSGDATARAGAAWFNVQASIDDGRLDEARVVRQGYVAVKGNDLMYPAVQADANGNAAMVLTRSGADRFGSAVFTTMASGQSEFGRIRLAAAGTASYNADPNFRTRWGDYSWAQLDPQTDTFWLATEYIPPLSGQTPDGINNWGTQVLNVRVQSED
jgi:hypothetical protein